jgi:hypothetical protein
MIRSEKQDTPHNCFPAVLSMMMNECGRQVCQAGLVAAMYSPFVIAKGTKWSLGVAQPGRSGFDRNDIVISLSNKPHIDVPGIPFGDAWDEWMRLKIGAKRLINAHAAFDYLVNILEDGFLIALGIDWSEDRSSPHVVLVESFVSDPIEFRIYDPEACSAACHNDCNCRPQDVSRNELLAAWERQEFRSLALRRKCNRTYFDATCGVKLPTVTRSPDDKTCLKRCGPLARN